MKGRARTDRKALTDEGFVLIGAVILAVLGLIVIASALMVSSTSARTSLATNKRSNEFYKAEGGLGAGVSWLRLHSTSLASPFSRSTFYSTFDRSASSVGANDDSDHPVLTRIKMQGSNDSPLITTHSDLGTASFPATIDTVSAETFTAETDFADAEVGQDMVRITLIDAIPIEAAKDYGDPDNGNPPPQTDFNPIYRIEAMRDEISGGHVFAYLIGHIVYDSGYGFYGRDFVQSTQDCDSYVSNNGNYTSASKRANCPVASNGVIQVHRNSVIYGSARTNGSIANGSPWGGKVCANFANGCPNVGQKCQGTNCQVGGLPVYSPWATYCPTNQGNLNISSDSTLTVPGNAANQRCWNNVTIDPGKTLTLRTTAYPYFFEQLNLSNNGVLNFNPDPATGTINLYVKEIVGDAFNGNQILNINNKPYQLRLHYLGTDDLILNGTADMNVFLSAPYADVEVSGSFEFKGGIKATGLTMTGSGDLHYDESGDVTTISDVSYQIRNVTENYR